MNPNVGAPMGGSPIGNAAAMQPPGGGPPGGSPAAAGLPHDIRGTIFVPLPWWQIALIVLVAIAVLIAIFTAWKWWKKRQANRPLPPRDPWDELQERLQVTQPPVPFTKAAQIEYFAQLSLILREAIERRTQIPATDRTCQELKAPLRAKLPLKPTETEALLSFLERADFIKFAKAPTDTAEALSAHGHVVTWLRALVPLSIHQQNEQNHQGASDANEGANYASS